MYKYYLLLDQYEVYIEWGTVHVLVLTKVNLPCTMERGHSTVRGKRQTEAESKDVMSRSSYRGECSRLWQNVERWLGRMVQAASPVISLVQGGNCRRKCKNWNHWCVSILKNVSAAWLQLVPQWSRQRMINVWGKSLEDPQIWWILGRENSNTWAAAALYDSLSRFLSDNLLVLSQDLF